MGEGDFVMQRAYSALGQRLCMTAATIGAFGLLAWALGWDALTTIVPGQPPLMANTALGLLLLGVAGAMGRSGGRGVARALPALASVVVLAIGAFTLAAYLGAPSYIDELLFAGGAEPHPGRMSPPTAVALALLAGAIVLFDVRAKSRFRPSEWLALSAGLIALTAAAGQLLGVGPHYRFEDLLVTAVPVHAALALLLLSVGFLLRRTDAGLMKIAASAGPGGVMLRRLATAAVLGPLALGLLLMRFLAVLGVDQLPLVYACLSVAATVVGLGLLTATAVPLDRIHADLEATRSRAHALIEQASEGIFVADIDGRYTDLNSAACRMLGYTRDELVGKLISDLVPPEEHERLARHKATLLRGESHLEEWSLRRKDGTLVPVEVSATIHRDGRWEAFVRDVSERRRVESEKELLAQVGTLLGSTLEAECTLRSIATLLVRHVADVCIIDVVDDGQRTRRLKAARVDDEQVCEGPMAAPPEGPIAMLSASGATHPLLFEHVSPETISSLALDDAEPRGAPLRSLIVAPLVVHDELMGAVTLVSTTPSRAFTERDGRLVDELAQRTALWLENVRLYRAAQRAIKGRDDVLGVVAHDLRNPLGAILLQASLLRRQLETADRPRKPAEVIERAAKRMNRLIQDLLDVTRMEAGHLTIEAARRPSRSIVCDAIEAQRPLADAASLELRLELPEDLPDVWADRDRLFQVFENLVGNAIKFACAGGRITVGAAPRDRDVLFWVADTGRGISDEDLPHLFERFWQVKSGECGGAGMGLPIVKGIVEAHGGRVWVESIAGRGTTFFFTIPSASTVLPSQPVAAAAG